MKKFVAWFQNGGILIILYHHTLGDQSTHGNKEFYSVNIVM